MPLLQDMLPTYIYSYMAVRFLSEPKVDTGDCDTYFKIERMRETSTGFCLFAPKTYSFYCHNFSLTPYSIYVLYRYWNFFCKLSYTSLRREASVLV